jgi:hypothetical protein
VFLVPLSLYVWQVLNKLVHAVEVLFDGVHPAATSFCSSSSLSWR